MKVAKLCAALAVASLTILGGLSARASTLDDPLHGLCGTGCNTDNGQFAPLDSLSQFGWAYSGPAGDNTGSLSIIALVPTSDVSFVSPTLTGTNLSMGSVLSFVGTWTLASSTDLAAFLGFPNSSPANPFGAFQVGANTGVTAFNVFEINIPGILTLNNTSQALADAFSASGGAGLSGIDLVAFLTGTPDGTVSTAPSGQLQVTPFAVATPLPAGIWLFIGPLLAGWYWFKRKMKASGRTLQPA